jgi:hypothetical protein
MPSWFDRFGQEWASVGLTDDPTYAQSDAGWAYIGQAPPTVEQFNSVFQWNDDKDNWLYGQVGNVIASANMLPDPNDLTQLLRAINSKLKLRLTTGYTIWCDAINGSDGNTGAQGSPFRTIQHAVDWALENIEPAHNWVTIQLQPGTYEPVTLQVTWNGGILIQGDIANPRSYLVKNTNGYAIQAAYAGWIAVQGLSVEAQGGDTDYETYGVGLAGVNSGIVIYKDIAFGPCSNVHMSAWSSGQVWSWGVMNYSIYGGARGHYSSSSSGICTAVRSTVTIQNNPMFSLAFACASIGGYVQTWDTVYIGTCRGRHAWLDAYGIANTKYINPDIHYPGDTASYLGRGGMYV